MVSDEEDFVVLPIHRVDDCEYAGVKAVIDGEKTATKTVMRAETRAIMVDDRCAQ